MEKREQLKYQVRYVPLKLLVSIVLAVGIVQSNDEDAFLTFKYFLLIYCLITCFSSFAKATGNWLSGIVLFFVITVILISLMMCQVLSEAAASFVIVILFLGGSVKDIYRVLKLLWLTIWYSIRKK